jgi:hypothetical protein
LAVESGSELRPGIPRWWARVAAVELLVLAAYAITAKLAGMSPFAERGWRSWLGFLLGTGAVCGLAVVYWKAARRADDRGAEPEAVAEPRRLDHVVAGCLALFFGVVCVLLVGDLIWHWFWAEPGVPPGPAT